VPTVTENLHGGSIKHIKLHHNQKSTHSNEKNGLGRRGGRRDFEGENYYRYTASQGEGKGREALRERRALAHEKRRTLSGGRIRITEKGKGDEVKENV